MGLNGRYVRRKRISGTSFPTAALNEVYKTTGDKVFTVDAGKGRITVDEDIQHGPRTWDLYGEHGKDLLTG